MSEELEGLVKALGDALSSRFRGHRHGPDSATPDALASEPLPHALHAQPGNELSIRQHQARIFDPFAL